MSGATGGMRCTRLCRAGMSQPGKESVPLKAEPSSVVLNLMLENRLFRYTRQVGIPQMAQQTIRIDHGTQA